MHAYKNLINIKGNLAQSLESNHTTHYLWLKSIQYESIFIYFCISSNPPYKKFDTNRKG